MARKSTLEQIAKEIAKLELNIQNNADQEAVKFAEDRINELISINKLTLEDMIQVDEIIQEILHR